MLSVRSTVMDSAYVPVYAELLHKVALWFVAYGLVALDLSDHENVSRVWYSYCALLLPHIGLCQTPCQHRTINRSILSNT